VLSWWRKISNLGVDTSLSNRNIRITRLINQFCLAFLILVTVSVVFQIVKHLLLSGEILLNTYLLLLTSLPMVLVFVLNAKKQIYISRLFLIIYQLVFHSSWALFVGPAGRIEYILFLFPIAIVLLFKKKKQQIILMAVCLLSFLIVYYGYNYIEPILPPGPNSNIALPGFIIGLIFSYALLQIYDNEVEIAEQNMLDKNKELEHFARAASHDMKEPLRNISSFSSLIQYRHKEELSSEVTEYVGFIEKASKRMTSLLSDLLAYATTGNTNESIEQVDLNLILSETKKDLASKIEETRTLIHSETLPIVPAYKTSMAQLFQNLINNAIKFQPKEVDNVPKILIKSDKIDGFHKITFEDNGIGIPQEKLNTIFDSFNKLHSKTEYEGSGLGLATCKKIVELHNGRIDVESVVGKGTAMILYLKAA